MADEDAPEFQFVRAQIDPDGYLLVATKVTEVDAGGVISAFLDMIDPAWLEDQAITLYPETSVGKAILDVLRGVNNGGA